MKKTVTQKTAKKIGLVVAINMLIGSIIGVGIFFKNNNIFAINDHNAVAVLIAWVLSAIISLFTAICFAEVSGADNSHSGLGGWAYYLVGRQFGTFVKIVQPFFYFCTIMFSISIFSSESILNIFNKSGAVNNGVIFLLGFGLFAIFMILNFLSIKNSARFQNVVSFLKFVPLLLVVIGGIYYGVTNGEDNLFNDVTHNQSPIKTTGILVSLPSILFAFDSFVSIGNLSKDMVNPKRNVPIAIISAMVIVGVFYVLVCVGQLLSNSGDIYTLFDKILTTPSARSGMRIFISVLISISVIGVLNAFCTATIRSCNSLVEDHTIMFSDHIKRLAHKIIPTSNDYKPGFLLSIIFYMVIFIALLIPSSILNTDAYVDGVSVFPITIFFGVYATVILFGFINRFTKRVQMPKIKGFLWFAPISIIGCYLVCLWQVFYTFTVATIINPNEVVNWGLFSTNGYVVHNWEATIVFFVYILIMFIYFIINKVVLNKQHYHQSYFEAPKKVIYG